MLSKPKETIVIVDDIPENLSLLNDILSPLYRVKAATRGLSAIKIIEKEKPFLVLLDIMMPEMDGYEVCQRLKNNPVTEEIPIIFVTAKAEIKDEAYGLELGAVDYIPKPINSDILLARVKTQLSLHYHTHHLQDLVDEKTAELQDANMDLQQAKESVEKSQLEIIYKLGRAAEFKDNETGMHVVRMSHYSRILANQLNLGDEFVTKLFHAAPMHDIGKIGIADEILLKPGPLTDCEFEIMKTHTTIGAEIIQEGQKDILSIAYKVALSHHEKWDGSGYPNGIKGIDIPLEGRIVAIADVFDALTSVRPYKSAWSVEKALEFLKEQSGRHFDPQLVNKFFDIIDEVLIIKSKFNAS